MYTDDLHRQLDLAAYGVVGTVKAVEWMLRETSLPREEAQKLLAKAIKEYNRIDHELYPVPADAK